jgi:myo-inositol 2-dehydrogenase/D-chiro-inositol 1-dehydrogenase
MLEAIYCSYFACVPHYIGGSLRAGIIIVGSGRMGSIHAENIRRSGMAELVAIVDTDEERARKASERFGAPYYLDLERAIINNKAKTHGVVIASPLTAHLDGIRIACDHGLHIFVEKPLAPSISQCREAVSIVKKAGVFLQIGYQRRYDKSYKEVKRSIDVGDIGRPFIAKFIARDPMPDPGIGIGSLYSGAIFDDMLTHEFDLTSWFFGFPPISIYAVGRTMCFKTGDYDNVLVVMEYSGGPLVSIEATRCSVYGHDLRLEILGEKGLLKLENIPEHSVHMYGRDNIARHPRLPWFAERFSEAYYKEIEIFIGSIILGERPTPNEEDGLRACAISDAAKRSAIERRPVTLSEML